MSKQRGMSKHGFTLLELLMVVIIIGILTSIALPQYIKMSERARSSEAMIILASVRSAQLRYRAGSPGNVFTATITDLDIDIPSGGAASTVWDYNTNTTHANATRKAGGAGSGTIFQNLTSGCFNASNAIWGLPTTAC